MKIIANLNSDIIFNEVKEISKQIPIVDYYYYRSKLFTLIEKYNNSQYRRRGTVKVFIESLDSKKLKLFYDDFLKIVK